MLFSTSCRCACTKICHRIAFSIEKFLPLANHSKIGIVKYTEDQRKFFQHCCCKFLNIHLHTAITGNCNHRTVRIANLRSDCSRKSISHGSKSTGHIKSGLFIHFQILGCEHLMLSYICHNNLVILFKHFIDRLQNILSLHLVSLWFHPKRMLLFPAFDLFHPAFFFLHWFYIFQ